MITRAYYGTSGILSRSGERFWLRKELFRKPGADGGLTGHLLRSHRPLAEVHTPLRRRHRRLTRPSQAPHTPLHTPLNPENMGNSGESGLSSGVSSVPSSGVSPPPLPQNVSASANPQPSATPEIDPLIVAEIDRQLLAGRLEPDIMEAMRTAHGATFQAFIRIRRQLILERLRGVPPNIPAGTNVNVIAPEASNPDDPDTNKSRRPARQVT